MAESIAELIRKVTDGEETVFDLLRSEDGTAHEVKISKRTLQPEAVVEKAVARAKARDHVFNDIEAFGNYLSRETAEETAVVLADVNSRTITAVLDEATNTDRETITLKALEHPLFTPWGRLLNCPIPVIDFSLFVMKHRRSVVEPDGRELAMVFQQVKMSKAIQIYKGVGKRSLNGVIVDIEIAGEKKGVPVELPEMIAIEVPLFVGTGKQRIELDVLVTDEKGDNVVVYLTAADVEQQRIVAFEEMVTRLKEQTGLLVGLGEIKHRDWVVVR